MTKNKNNGSIAKYLSEDSVRSNIKNTLGNRTQQFITSVVSLANSDPKLQKCDRQSLLSACLIAANLDLPVNKNLGFAYVIPYKDKAQFQMGYKGYIQLAQRSGQFITINSTDVRKGEIKGIDRLTGEMAFDWIDEDREKTEVIGYVAYFELKNGFKKSLYMTVEEIKQHATEYSKAYKSKSSTNLWRDKFDFMAQKTVLKLLLSRYAPMTSEMQTAQLADQAVVHEDGRFEYVDNQPIDPKEIAKEKEQKRLIKYIENAKTLEELEKCKKYIDKKTIDLYLAKEQELEKEVIKNNK